jgi:hypothetical protein
MPEITLRDVEKDIKRVVKLLEKEGKYEPEEMEVSDYARLGGKFDGRKLRPLGGFAQLLNNILNPEVAEQAKRTGIVEAYAEMFMTLGRAPTQPELSDAGHTAATVKHYFSSLTRLDRIARDTFPEKFFDVNIEDVLGDELTDRLYKTVRKHKKFVITTAVTGCAVDDLFLSSLKNYCDREDAGLLVLIASDPAHNRDRGGYGTIDNKVSREAMVVEDIHLNSNFFVSTIKLSAKQINPTTGLSDVGSRSGSFVFASPKQFLECGSTSGEKLPHVMMTTGAVTVPNYKTELYMSERTAYIANKHHVMGAVLVTIHDKERFSFTQIQAMNSDGSFVHLGQRYHADGEVSEDRPEVLVMGDWHSGSTCPMVKKCTKEIVEYTGAKKIAVHDGLDAISINHHEEHNAIIKARRFMSGAPSLQEEIEGYAKDLKWLAGMVEQVVIVKSNHDEFLSNNYLRYAKYAQDPQNHYYSLDLAKVLMEGKDPLKYAIEQTDPLAPEFERLRWLQRDEDFIVGGVQLGAHGDIGPSGTRGTLEGMRRSYGNSVTGHSHTPGIRHGARSVGTSTVLRLGYNRGPGSWLNTHALVYSDGSVQLVNMIEGFWH